MLDKKIENSVSDKCIDKYTSLPTYSTEEETVLGTMRVYFLFSKVNLKI